MKTSQDIDTKLFSIDSKGLKALFLKKIVIYNADQRVNDRNNLKLVGK